MSELSSSQRGVPEKPNAIGLLNLPPEVQEASRILTERTVADRFINGLKSPTAVLMLHYRGVIGEWLQRVYSPEQITWIIKSEKPKQPQP